MCYVLINISFGMMYGDLAAHLGILLRDNATSFSGAVSRPLEPCGDCTRASSVTSIRADDGFRN
jgi:hypothetical protein